MLMKKGFSFEALTNIKKNTKTAQEEMQVDDRDLVEVDENGVPLTIGEQNRDNLIQRMVDIEPTDREMPAWATPNQSSGIRQDLPDRQIQIQDNIAMFLPQGPEGAAQAEALADIVSDKIAQYGEPYNDVFWAVVGHGDAMGQVDWNTALHVADQASSQNQSAEVMKAVQDGMDPMEALQSIPLFGGGNTEPFSI